MKFLSYIDKTYHRNICEKYISKYKHLIKGKILDIGSKNRKYDHFFDGEIIAIDIKPNPELKIIKGDLINLEFQSNSFDSVICTEVFCYLRPENFKKGFDEIIRVLKSKSRSIITVPFYYKDFRDKTRYTFNYLSDYLNSLNNIKFKIFKWGNRYTTFYDLVRDSKKIPNSRKLKFFGKNLILFILYLMIKLFSLEAKNDDYYSGSFILLTKK